MLTGDTRQSERRGSSGTLGFGPGFTASVVSASNAATVARCHAACAARHRANACRAIDCCHAPAASPSSCC